MRGEGFWGSNAAENPSSPPSLGSREELALICSVLMPAADQGPLHHPCSLFPTAGSVLLAASCSSSLAALSSAKESDFAV